MPNSVAEIVTLPLKAGTDLTTGSHAKSWTEGLTQVASDSRCKSIHWGHQVEHPETVCLVLGKLFQASYSMCLSAIFLFHPTVRLRTPIIQRFAPSLPQGFVPKQTTLPTTEREHGD
jgi:hypothetical protein